MIKLFPILFFLSNFIVQAQYIKKEDKVNVIAYWEKGDEYVYEQLEKEYKINKTDTVITKDKKFDVKIKIVDQDSTSYTIYWENTPDLSEYPPAIAKVISDKVGNSVFKYKTDEFGSFEELLNIDEIIAFNQRTMDLILESIDDQKTKNDFEEVSKIIMQNQEVIMQFAISKINTFHFFFGHSIESKKPLELEFENINPVTKNKILYKQLLELDSVDEVENTYALYSETIPDQHNLIGEIKSTLETIIAKEVKDMDKIKNFDFISKIFQVNHDSGVILYQMKRDFIDFDDQEVIKEIEFILK